MQFIGRAANRRDAIAILLGVTLTTFVSAWADPIDAFWTNPAGGFWQSSTNWSTKPDWPNNGGGLEYNAIIDLVSGTYSIDHLMWDVEVTNFTLDSLSATVNGYEELTVLDTFNLRSGRYRVLSGAEVRVQTMNLTGGEFSFESGKIIGGQWNVDPGTFVIRTQLSKTLDHVSLKGELLVDDGYVGITNGFAAYGDLRMLNTRAEVEFLGTQTFERGRILFDGEEGKDLTISGGTLTVAPDAVIEGINGFFRGDGTLLNQGRMIATGGYYGLDVETGGFINEGIVEARARVETHNMVNMPNGEINIEGGRLVLDDDWTNKGVINVNGGTLELGGTFRHDDVGTVNRNGGYVTLTGEMDNTGNTLTLDESTGEWRLYRGTIRGGTIELSDPSKLVYSDRNTLDGVHLDSSLVIDHGGVHLTNGSTVSGSIEIFESGTVGFDAGTTLDNRTIPLTGSGLGHEAVLSAEGTGDLVLGPDLHVRGRSAVITCGRFSPPDAGVVNKGLITAEGRAVWIEPGKFTNEGIVEAVGGVRLHVGDKDRMWVNESTGLIRAVNSQVDFESQGLNQGTLELRSGALGSVDPRKLDNLDGTTLRGGTWAIYDSWFYSSHASSKITTNDAAVLLSGPTARFDTFNTLDTNLGSFTITDGRDFTTVGDLRNEGGLAVGVGSTLSVTGNLTQTEGSALLITLGGLAPGEEFGLVEVFGTATLKGTLLVDLLAGYSPEYGDRFEILTAATIQDNFDHLDLPALPGGLFFDIDYALTSVALSVVPEPTTLMFAAFAIGLRRTRWAARQNW